MVCLRENNKNLAMYIINRLTILTAFKKEIFRPAISKSPILFKTSLRLVVLISILISVYFQKLPFFTFSSIYFIRLTPRTNIRKFLVYTYANYPAISGPKNTIQTSCVDEKRNL